MLDLCHIVHTLLYLPPYRPNQLKLQDTEYNKAI